MRHGFLLIEKAVGPTSHDVVQQARRVLSERSIGHLGTLDPNASGLLVLAVGSKALKILEYFTGLHKEYTASIKFGSVSSTYDADGVIETYAIKPGVPEPEESDIKRVLEQKFIGNIKQVPPAHSAVHVNGERAYDLARRGQVVVIKPRDVQILSCKILSFAYPDLSLQVRCGSGTYIRSLAHDLGEALRCGAYLSDLRRTKVGEWSVENAVEVGDATWTDVMPLKDILKNHPSINLTADEFEDVKHGRTIGQKIEGETFAWFEGLPVAVMLPARKDPEQAQPRKVL